MGALAEFERALIVERTQAGLKAARARGVRVGRPRKLTVGAIDHARKLIATGEPASTVARSLGVDSATLYRALALARAKAAGPAQSPVDRPTATKL